MKKVVQPGIRVELTGSYRQENPDPDLTLEIEPRSNLKFQYENNIIVILLLT